MRTRDKLEPVEVVELLRPGSWSDPEDIDTWLRGSYDEIVALQNPYDPTKSTVRGPVFPTQRDKLGSTWRLRSLP